MTWEEWVAFEAMCLALSSLVGAPLGILIHHLLAQHYGWVFDPETKRWE